MCLLTSRKNAFRNSFSRSIVLLIIYSMKIPWYTHLDDERRVTVRVNGRGGLALRALRRHPGSRACVASDTSAAGSATFLQVTGTPLFPDFQTLQLQLFLKRLLEIYQTVPWRKCEKCGRADGYQSETFSPGCFIGGIEKILY